MSESNPTPPQFPQQTPPTPPPPPHTGPFPSVPPTPPRMLGEDPEERAPITSPVTAIEAILRQPRRVMYQLRQPGAGALILYFALTAIFCALVYGVVVGTFSMKEQLWIAPVKIAGGLMLTTLLLVGFAPVAWLFSESTNSVNWMGALHLLFFIIATIFGLRFLTAAFSHSQARSNAGFATWVVIFLLVALQMTTALRPIVGGPTTFFPTEKKFFLSYWADCLNPNAERPNDSTR